MGATVRVGLIGCGGIARTHAAALAELEEAEFVACCDIVEEKARALAERHGVPRVYTDPEQMLSSGEVEAVTVCSPHPSHGPLVVAAARAGVHVICEKPLTTSLEEADRMVAAAGKAGIKFGTIFQRRFYPASQRIRRAIDEGRLGRLTLGECFARIKRDRAYFDRDAWRGRWDTEGGGVLMNQAVHVLDLLQWYMGPAAEVYGRWATLKHGDYIEVEDTAVATVAFENGALGVIECATTFDPPFGFEVAVHGTSGAVAGYKESPEGVQAINEPWTFPGEEERREMWEREESGHSGFPTYHKVQLRDFLQAVRDDREPAVSGAEGRKSLELIQAIYLSERTRKPVQLPLAADAVAAAR